MWWKTLRLAPITALGGALFGKFGVYAICDELSADERKELVRVLAMYKQSVSESSSAEDPSKVVDPVVVPLKPQQPIKRDDYQSVQKMTVDEVRNARAALEKYYRYKARDVLNQYRERMKTKGEAVPEVPKVPEAPKKSQTKAKPRAVRPEKLFHMLEEEGGPMCVPYVIVGGGTAAWSAVQAIQAKDPGAAVLVIADEKYPPYNRTPLSKERWDSKDDELTYLDYMGRKRGLVYNYVNVDPDEARCSMLLSSRVVGLDLAQKALKTDHGRVIEYQKLLIATGGKPKGPEKVNAALSSEGLGAKLLTFRSVDDFQRLHDLTRNPETRHVTVFGGGFLGMELATSLHRREEEHNFKTTLMFSEPGPLYKLVPRYLSEFLANKLRAAGIEVRSSTVITGVENSGAVEQGSRVKLETLSFDHDALETDVVVLAVGIEPNTDLATISGMEVDGQNGGILVDEELRAGDGVYAAGDVASFLDPLLGRRRVEHWDHAVVSGAIAGDNMAGGSSKYGLQSMFWCDLSAIGVQFEAVGLHDAKLDTVGVWNLEEEANFARFPGSFSRNRFSSGIVWYLKDSQVVGALLWNMPHSALEKARNVIESKSTCSSEQELKNLVPLPAAQHSLFIGIEDSR